MANSAAAQKRAILLLVICGILWSIAGIFIKLVPWNPLTIAGWRGLIASVCIFTYIKLKKKKIRINKSSIATALLMGASSLLFVSANKLTTSANAIVLQFTAPVFLLVFSAVIFRQRFAKADLITVILTMSGISLFFLDQLDTGRMLGNIIGLLSGTTMAGMYMSTNANGEDDRMSGLFLGHFATGLLFIPTMFIFPTPITAPAIWSILILGIVQLGIPYILFGLAAGDCPPLAASLLGVVEPLCNPLWVFIFAHEIPGPFALTGGAVIILTVTAYCIWRDRMTAYARQQAG